jgi:linoleoyl-CoA desaturase
MATHAGFSRSRSLDFIAAHLFDLSGMSGLEWQITHQTHHNQPHSSIDHQTNTYDYLGVRIHKHMQRQRHHRYQAVYFRVVVSAYLFFKFFTTTGWLWTNREFIRHRREAVAHLVAKGILIAQVVACVLMHGGWEAVALFVVYAATYSQTAFILLFNDHQETHEILGEVEDITAVQGKLSWAEVQVRTSGDWYPTNWLLRFIEFHYGYFNYHIEHHLFPTLKPRLLKKISPIVKRVCEKHGVPYRSTPLHAVQASLQRHLEQLAQPTAVD